MKNGLPIRLLALAAALACILCLFAGCGADTVVPENGQTIFDGGAFSYGCQSNATGVVTIEWRGVAI